MLASSGSVCESAAKITLYLRVHCEIPITNVQHGINAFRDGVGALGSPGFISPEIIIGEPHTYAMDVFAVGVILFVLLVGRKPFNIADSESLNYCAMKLAECPGIKDPRYHSTFLVGRRAFNMLSSTVCTKGLLP